ncbi:MAG: metallophosphoesterase family protein [Bacteroidota bacterium]|nr:metallophosphoesterase family protein [Bacteroidota bacterium]
MTKIGLLSDTHNYLHPAVFEFFEKCDEIWHAGDIGNILIADKIARFKPLRAVYGNIDGQDIRVVYPKNLRFMCENVDVWMTHIGGYPGHYSIEVRNELFRNPPKLFISGHSHILKVMYDKKLQLLHINPGAAGKYGFQRVKTLIRFEIDSDRIQNLEVIELKDL